jgi:hypothetical protein
MADTDTAAADPEDIYNLATECNGLFSQFRSQVRAGRVADGSGSRINPKIVEGHEQRFWGWARGLAVFSEPWLSLDTKLQKYPGFQEQVMLLLDMIKTNLKEGQYRTITQSARTTANFT